MGKILGALLVSLLTLSLATLPVASSGAQSTAETAKVATSDPVWRLVVNDQFKSGSFPAHWLRYDGRYGSGAENCARPDHAFVKDGKMRMVLRYRTAGRCGRGWYSAGMMLAKEHESIDQKISIRFRVELVRGITGHRILPMRWPSSDEWRTKGEEDLCESSLLDGCATFLHGVDGRVDREYKVNQARWHTYTFARRNFTVRTWIDGKRRWVYRGNKMTLPPTLKRPVLQQECRLSCPRGRVGREVILIEWIKIWNPR
jgi:hypothetical protein